LKYGVSLLISGARNCARDTRYTAPNQHRRVASRRTPSSFCLPKKRKQKKGTPLLARLRRVPFTARPPGGRKRFAALSFPPVAPVGRSVPAASQGG
jgi:hypothetical protein